MRLNTTKKLLALIVFIALIIIINIFLPKLTAIENINAMRIISFIIIILALLVIFNKNISSMLKGVDVTSVEILPIPLVVKELKEYFLTHYGDHVNIKPIRVFEPELESGLRDPQLRAYVYMPNGDKIALKVPIARGTKTIKNGLFQTDEHHTIIFDKKEDDLLSPHAKPEPLNILRDLPSDKREEVIVKAAESQASAELKKLGKPKEEKE